MVTAATVVAAISGALTVAALAAVISGAPKAVLLAPATLLAAGGGLTAWLPRVAYRHWRFAAADNELHLRHGVVFRTESSIPYFRVQHVDIEQGPLDRAFGLSQLIVRTASATSDASIPGLAEADAAALRALILERAGRGDAV